MSVKAFRWCRSITVLALAILMSGCASGARTGCMTMSVTADTIVSESSPLHSTIKIGTVTGGKETNPLWKSNVSNENFRQALEQSLSLETMITSKEPRYLINADLIDLDQPFVGTSMTVTARVHYTVVGNSDQDMKLDETVVTPYTAKFSDSFLGVERLRLANEGAIRENIHAMIVKLIAASQPGQPLSQ